MTDGSSARVGGLLTTWCQTITSVNGDMNQFVLDWEEGHPSRLMAQADGLGGHWGMIDSCADNAAKQAQTRQDQRARVAAPFLALPRLEPAIRLLERWICRF